MFNAATAKSLVKDLGQPIHESEIAAENAVPGVVTGLAFTPVGGEILFVEARRMPGASLPGASRSSLLAPGSPWALAVTQRGWIFGMDSRSGVVTGREAPGHSRHTLWIERYCRASRAH